MFTLGFGFRPWEDVQAIANGADILRYINDTVDMCGLHSAIAFNKTVVSANYQSDRATWTVKVRDTMAQRDETWECNFLHGCTGYYSYDEAHDPIRKVADAYSGHLVHPQYWPDDLDVAGKKVVVIGSGATAMSLVPALADQAAHVTMLQRSPSFVLSIPAQDTFVRGLSAIFPAKLTYRLARPEVQYFTRSALGSSASILNSRGNGCRKALKGD